MRIELLVAGEELGTASPALIDARSVGVPVLAGVRPLGAGLAQHPVLFRGQFLAPLLVGLSGGRGNLFRSGAEQGTSAGMTLGLLLKMFIA